MKSIEEKFIELKNKMQFFDIYQNDDEVGLALKNLENEINTYRAIDIYKEDFSNISWSYITKNQDINFVTAFVNVD